MPTGPTDPDSVLAAIAAGCGNADDRLTFGTGNLLRLGLERSGGVIGPSVWHLSTAGSIGVSAQTFALLQQGEPSLSPPGFVRIDRLLYALEEVEGMAELQPA